MFGGIRVQVWLGLEEGFKLLMLEVEGRGEEELLLGRVVRRGFIFVWGSFDLVCDFVG